MIEESSDLELKEKTGDKTNAEAHTWKEQPGSFGYRSRLHGHELWLRPVGAPAVELTSDDLREIESAASKITVQGARLPESAEQMTGR